jgi:hypothetical protein
MRQPAVRCGLHADQVKAVIISPRTTFGLFKPTRRLDPFPHSLPFIVPILYAVAAALATGAGCRFG